jgi:hypothetical protein
MELAIVVARRSWREISLGKGTKKEKSEKGKKESLYPNSRAQPPSPGDCDQLLGPNSHRKVGTEVDNQVAAPTEARTPTLHRATNRSPKSANGRMATEAAWLNGNKLTERRKQNYALTSTGLLMEGVDDDSSMVHFPKSPVSPILWRCESRSRPKLA